MQAYILAGGKGRRLWPLTRHVPKPLIPLDGVPILEIILLQLRRTGIERVTLLLGYEAHSFIEYFGDGTRVGLELSYIHESHPLGTAGPLSLVPWPEEPLLVMNGDILTDLDFAELYRSHRTSNGAATTVLCPHAIDLEYGVVDIDEHHRMRNYREKPRINFWISSGIYILEPYLLNYLPRNSYTDMPALLQSARQDGRTINGFLFNGDWFDIGTQQKLAQAEDAFRKHRSRYLHAAHRAASPYSSVLERH